MLQQKQQAVTQDSTDTIERKGSIKQPNITQRLARVYSCYIQAPGLPQCCNLINTNRNNDYTSIG